MASKKKYQERLEELERARQARIAKSAEKGEKVRAKVSSYKGSNTHTSMTHTEIDEWTSKATGISLTQGKNADRKAGRTKGRFLKGKL